LHYTHYGEPSKGHTHYQKALKLDPENPDFLFNLAQLYLTQFPVMAKELETDEKSVYLKAMDYSKDAAKFAPDDFELQKDYATNFYAGENFGVEVDWTKAAAAWEATYALAKQPRERFFARLNEGRCWIFAGNTVSAIEALEAARAIDPTSQIVLTTLAELKGTSEAKSPKSVGGGSKIGRKKAR
jgi:tetratricopeptide (TPR) repeat protein